MTGSEERGHGVRAFINDQLIQRIRHACGERFLALAVLVFAIVVRELRVPHHRQRQAEIGVHVGLARDADGSNRIAVVAVLPADNLVLLRTAHSGLVIPGELDGRVVGFRARALEQRLGHRHGRELDQLLGEVDIRFVRPVPVGVVVAELAHLVVRHAGDALAGGKAERGAPQPRHRLDVTLARIVVDVDALAAADDDGAVRLVLAQIGLRMDVVGHVSGGGGVRERRHCLSFLLWRRLRWQG
jgi:hypothetical protein